MFSKIKSIWASVKASIKGFTMSGAPNETLLQKLETDISAEVHKVEDFIHPTVAKVEVEVQAAAPVLAAAVKPLTDNVITGVKDLLALADRLHPEFDKIATLAKAAVGTDDLDAILTKLKALLHYAGAKTDVWDEVVAVAKVL
jgi:hypothetical protein